MLVWQTIVNKNPGECLHVNITIEIKYMSL